MTNKAFYLVMEFLRKNFTLAIFTVFVFGVVLIIYSQGNALWEGREVLRWQLGRSLGRTAIIVLSLVYARTFLKLLVQRGSLRQRLAPIEDEGFSTQTLLQKTLYYFNLTHPYLGVIALATIFLHAYLAANLFANWPLLVVLLLLAWQGFWGFVLKFKYTPAVLKRQGLKLHSQFITGILILVLALIGHQLFD